MNQIYYQELPELKSHPANIKSFTYQTKEWREKRLKLLEQKLSSNLTHYDMVATKKNDWLCFFALLGVILQIVLLFVDFDTEKLIYIETKQCYILKMMISASTLILVLLQINYYHVLAIIEDTKWGFPTIWSGFLNSSLIYKAAFEIIICVIHPMPWMPAEWDSIGLFMIFRGFLFFRFLKYHSRIFRQRNRILHDNAFLKRKKPIYGWKLVMKMYFYTHSLTAITIVYSSIILVGAFCIQIVERADNPSLSNYGDALYFTIISCASIGYGDIYPQTHLGKIIDCLFAIIGIITLSFVVSLGDRALRMRSVELFSVESMGVILLDSKKSNIAAIHIQSVWRLRRIMKKYKKWPYTPEEAANLSVLQQRIAALLIGKIKFASRSMHRYRIRQMGLSTFYKKEKTGKKEKDNVTKSLKNNEDNNEKKSSEKKIEERKNIHLIKSGFNLK